MVSAFHSISFNIIDDGISVVFASTVIFGSMYMHYQRLSTDTLGDKSRLIGKPVMSMYDIKIILTGHSSRYQGITIDFLKEVIPILTREFESISGVMRGVFLSVAFFLPIGGKNLWGKIRA